MFNRVDPKVVEAARKWFGIGKTADQIKNEYRKLARQHHPDLNPDRAEEATRIMQEINAAYDYAVHHAAVAETPDWQKEKWGGDKAKEEAYYEEAYEINVAVRKVVEALVILEGITIEVCGTCVWVGGNTYIYRSILSQELEMKWAPKKRLWVFFGHECHNRRAYKMSDIRSKYGSVKVQSSPIKSLG
jgi:hypothetical protein